MNEYRKLIILQYFINKENNYDINEITNELGISQVNVSQLISELIEENMLKYNNYLLKITDKGRQVIGNSDIYYIYDDIILNNDVHISKRLSIDDVYIPKKFTKKV